MVYIPVYLADILVPLFCVLNVELHSNDNPIRVDEPRALGGHCFASHSCFLHLAV